MGIVVNNTDYTVLHAKDKNGHNATEITIQKNGKTAKIKIFAGSDNTYNAGDKIVIKGDNEITSANQNFVLNILKELNGKNNHGEFENKELKRPSSSTTFNPFSINPENIAEPKTFSDLMAELDGTKQRERNEEQQEETQIKNFRIDQAGLKALGFKDAEAKVVTTLLALDNENENETIKDIKKQLIEMKKLNSDDAKKAKAKEVFKKVQKELLKQTDALLTSDENIISKTNTAKSQIVEAIKGMGTDDDLLKATIKDNVTKENIVDIWNYFEKSEYDGDLLTYIYYDCNDTIETIKDTFTNILTCIKERATYLGIKLDANNLANAQTNMNTLNSDDVSIANAKGAIYALINDLRYKENKIRNSQ